jgi:hypothetical protein
MKLLSWALAGHACYNIPSLAISDQDLRTIRSKVKAPGDMAEASPACRLVSLMPIASDRSNPARSIHMIRVHQGKLGYGFAPGTHLGNRQPQCQTSVTNTQVAFTDRNVHVSPARSEPRPKGQGTPRVFGRPK